MGAPRFVLDRFWPSNLFLGGIPGAWYDPTDLSTMFQDSTGTTPVTAVEQPVGRILDKSGNANHATQATAASRPTYRARYNLLTYSEQFNNAAWTKAGLNTTGTPPWVDVTTAPDGTNTADQLIELATLDQHVIYQNQTVVAGTYTFSVYAKSTGGAQRWISMYPQGTGVVAYAIFDINAGAVTLTGGAQYVSSSVSSVGNGWFRCSVTFTSGAVSVANVVYLSNASNTQAPVYTGNGSSGAYIWGAQLLTAADVTATGNAYQRIAAATVYDTAPIFRPYLAFDGVDDSLATAAINFTATDKMTVFAGLTKSSGAALGMVTELGNRNIVQAGSFSLTAPRNAGAPDYSFIVEGTAVTDNTIVTYIAPITNVMTARGDIAASLNQLRVNGAVAGTLTTTLGTGNFGNWALNIGRRNNTNLPFNGRIYELIVRGAASSTTEIIDTETWVNARTGAF